MSLNLIYKELSITNTEYNSLLNNQTIFKKETEITKTIPKSGFIAILLERLNFKLGNQQSFSKLDQKYLPKIAARAFISKIYFSLFAENEDLEEEFESFETHGVKEKLSYAINKSQSYKYSLNELLLDYIQQNKGLIELRLYFDKEFVVIATTQFSLIDLIINSNGLDSELPLFNTDNEQIASINLKINLQKTNSIPLSPLALNPYSVIQLNFHEVIYERNLNNSALQFNFQFEQRPFKSNKYQLDSMNYSYEFNDNYFCLKTSDVQAVIKEGLEIKIMCNDKLFGFANLDLSFLLKGQKSDFFYYDGYLTVIGSDFMNPNGVKMRIGVKIFGFLFENDLLAERNEKFIHCLNHSNFKKIEELREKNEDYDEVLRQVRTIIN